MVDTRLIDVHIHLDSTEYQDIPGLIKRSVDNGVVAVVAAGTTLSSSQRLLAIRRNYPNFVFLALGIHPERPEESEAEIEGVVSLIRESRDEVVAVGEVGLPYYSIRGKEDFRSIVEGKKPVLRMFLKLAQQLDLATVLHAPHQVAKEAFAVAKEVKAKRLLFHWHKSPPEVTRAIVEEGYYISVTPEVCYESRDRELVKLVPLSNLLLETDGPWPYEQEFQGKKTEPSLLRRVIQEVASLKELPETVVAERTTENAIRLFNLPLKVNT